MNARELASFIRALPCRDVLLSEIDLLSSDVVRLTTKLLRPDGSYVDVFVDAGREPGAVTVTDFGETWAFVEQMAHRGESDDLASVAASYDVSVEYRSLYVTTRLDGILGAALQVAQACVAVCMTGMIDRPAESKRAVVQSSRPSVRNSVVDQLSGFQISFRQRERIKIDTARRMYDVQVDVLVEHRSSLSALMIIERSPYEKVVTRHADHAFGVYTDLREADWRGRRISIVDDADLSRLRRSDSLIRLERVSTLIAVSDLSERVSVL
jgi:hypothetical protein